VTASASPRTSLSEAAPDTHPDSVGGRFRLYKANVDSGFIEEMNVPSCSARYPTVSPNGEWIAFSCDQGGTWQLEVMNLNSREQKRLTSEDCNSISPVWSEEAKDLIYATDCGRGLGLTALARLQVFR
jgi:Tol biopolymer transport system component